MHAQIGLYLPQRNFQDAVPKAEATFLEAFPGVLELTCRFYPQVTIIRRWK